MNLLALLPRYGGESKADIEHVAADMKMSVDEVYELAKGPGLAYGVTIERYKRREGLHLAIGQKSWERTHRLATQFVDREADADRVIEHKPMARRKLVRR